MLLEIGLDRSPLTEKSTLFSPRYKVTLSHHTKIYKIQKINVCFLQITLDHTTQRQQLLTFFSLQGMLPDFSSRCMPTTQHSAWHSQHLINIY